MKKPPKQLKVHAPTELDMAVGRLIDQGIAAGLIKPNWIQIRRDEIKRRGI